MGSSLRNNYSNAAIAGIQNNYTENFEYVGKTALTVTGNKTGNRYRFYRPGDIQAINYLDVEGMITIPVLKKSR